MRLPRSLARILGWAAVLATVAACDAVPAVPDLTVDAFVFRRDVGPVPDVMMPDASGSLDASAVPPIFVGFVEDVPSSWNTTGGVAGSDLCATVGGGRACNHEELLAAIGHGQLSDVPSGTTAWVYRLETVVVGGVALGPGDGAHCNHYTYDGNDLADGEFVTFGEGGTIVYHYDVDPYYDGVSREHVDSSLPCGRTRRALLCCN